MKLFFTIIFALILTLSCSKKMEEYTVKKQSITESVYASGSIESENQHQIFTTINGTIKDILVIEGDIVKKNQPLITIENNTTSLNQKNAEIIAKYSSIENNKVKLSDLKLTIQQAKQKYLIDSIAFDRQKILFSRKIISKSEFEQNELIYLNSSTNLKTLKLRLIDLENQLKFNNDQTQNNLELNSFINDELIIKSEISGKIYSILKKKGELVNNQSPLIIIGSNNDFKINLQIDEYDIIKIVKGQKVIVALDSYKDKSFEAIITKINPIMNERTKTFNVEAHFVKKPPTLYPNLTLEANIIISEKNNVFTIPRKFLLKNNHVLNENDKLIPVVVGMKDYEKVEIIKGISENQKIHIIINE